MLDRYLYTEVRDRKYDVRGFRTTCFKSADSFGYAYLDAVFKQVLPDRIFFYKA
jgi:hypothetical protein